MTFANPLPWWLFVSVVVAAGGLAWIAYARTPLAPVRRAVLSGLRFVSLLALVVLIMRPVASTRPDDSPVMPNADVRSMVRAMPRSRRISSMNAQVSSQKLVQGRSYSSRKPSAYVLKWGALR